MLFFFFGVIYSYKVEQLTPGQSTKITIEPNVVLVPVNAAEFNGKSGDLDFFGETSKYILNITKETKIIVTNPSNSETRSFEYYLFPTNKCSATGIFINPENNWNFSVSNDTTNNQNALQMKNSQKICFYFVWSSNLHYSFQFNINNLEEFDSMKYTMDVENIPNQLIDSSIIINVSNKNAMSIVFETDYIYNEGSADFLISSNDQISGTLLPNIENSITFGEGEWITLDEYQKIYNQDINIDDDSSMPWLHITGITIASLIGFVILYSGSYGIYNTCCWLECCYTDPDDLFCCACGMGSCCCGLL